MFLLPVTQWQFWHLGWHFWPFTLQRHPPLVSPGPLQTESKHVINLLNDKINITSVRIFVPRHERLTLGPHRGPLVTQQISVWQTVQRSQSHPSLFCTMMPHWGQCIASPDCTSVCDSVILKKGEFKFCALTTTTKKYTCCCDLSRKHFFQPTLRRFVVLLAAESFIAHAARSSWYCLQFFPSCID